LKDSVVEFAKPSAFVDGLTELPRNGAGKLLASAVEAEVAEFSSAVQVLSRMMDANAWFATGICRSARLPPPSLCDRVLPNLRRLITNPRRSE
jgi:hypothetical protein